MGFQVVSLKPPCYDGNNPDLQDIHSQCSLCSASKSVIGESDKRRGNIRKFQAQVPELAQKGQFHDALKAAEEMFELIETEGLTDVMQKGGWLDLMRQDVDASEKLYTWWSYRAKDWAAADRGRRLDHIWSSRDLGPHLQRIEILREARGWDRPSDHVPVTAHFNL